MYMSTVKQQIEHILQEKRPHLSKSSAKTYVATVNTICRKHNITGNVEDHLDKNATEIITSLSQLTVNTRKTVLCALFVITGNDDYNKAMRVDAKVSQTNNQSCRMTAREKDN